MARIPSIVRTAASWTLAITKSVNVRPCSSAARTKRSFWSADTRASRRSVRGAEDVFAAAARRGMVAIPSATIMYGQEPHSARATFRSDLRVGRSAAPHSDLDVYANSAYKIGLSEGA